MVGVPLMMPALDTVTPGGQVPIAENVSASVSLKLSDTVFAESAVPTVPVWLPMFGPGKVGAAFAPAAGLRATNKCVAFLLVGSGCHAIAVASALYDRPRRPKALVLVTI